MIDFLFYKFYNYILKTSNNDKFPHWGAMSFVGGSFNLNILTLIEIYEQVSGKHLLEITRINVGIIGLSIFIPLYFKIIYKKKYVEIINRFNEIEQQKNNKNKNKFIFIFIGYCVITLFFGIFISEFF